MVIPRRMIRPIRIGNIQIRFYGKGPFDHSGTKDAKTPTGRMKVAMPETTAWDLVRYPKAGGGLDNIITVLSELAENLDAKRLDDTVKRHNETIVAQRLGYLLDIIGRQGLTKDLADWIAAAPLRPLLAPGVRFDAPEAAESFLALV